MVTMIQSSKVFDLSSIEPQQPHQDQQYKRSSPRKSLDSEDPFSPSDYSNTDDSESSVSSHSTVGSTSTNGTPRRSMFRKYWTNTGQEPQLLTMQRTPKTVTCSIPEDHETTTRLGEVCKPQLVSRSSSSGSIDSTVSCSSSGTSASSSSSSSAPRRRSILPAPPAARSQSVPSLHTHEQQEASRQLRRKSSSSNDLKPSGSCLRETRFSGRKVQRRSSNTPVRFDMEAIDVVHFEPPQERYAEQGWSDFFQ